MKQGNVEPEEIIWIGGNEYDYTFGICRFGENWHGFANGKLPPPESAMIFFFPFDGIQDKTEALKKTVAFAFHIENGYGGISKWMPEFTENNEVKNARAKDFLCRECGAVFCEENCYLEDEI